VASNRELRTVQPLITTQFFQGLSAKLSLVPPLHLTSSPTERACAGATPLAKDPDDRRAARHPPHDRRQRPRPHNHLPRPGLGTGLRLAAIVGLDVGDVFAPDGTPRVRVRVRAAIAKGGREGERAGSLIRPDPLL
jgi:hypothetical protein